MDEDQVAIPWDPIPPEAANGWLHINIDHFEYDQDVAAYQDRLALLLISDLDEGEGRHAGMWRVEFAQVLAFRMSGAAFWFRRLSVAEQPPERGLWEVVRSKWLNEVAESHGQRSPASFPYPLHHYALVEETIALYEAIASRWTSQRLSDDEIAQALIRSRI
jgi:hypothetical protein